MLAAEAEACITDMATEPPSPMFCNHEETRRKINIEPSWKNTSVFLGNDEHFSPEPLSAQGNSAEECTYRFQEEDAAEGTSSAPSDPDRSTVNSILLYIRAITNAGIK